MYDVTCRASDTKPPRASNDSRKCCFRTSLYSLAGKNPRLAASSARKVDNRNSHTRWFRRVSHYRIVVNIGISKPWDFSSNIS